MRQGSLWSTLRAAENRILSIKFLNNRLIYFAIFFSSLCLSAQLVAPPLAGAISIEKESQLGKKFLASIRRHFQFLNDEYAQSYINRLGQTLSQGIETRPFPFHYYIIKHNDLNAFAGPGGHIFIYSGLISALDNADELAGVLAHEMGHITARHLSERIEQGKKINIATMAAILAGVFVGGKVGAALSTGSVAAGIQTQLRYSRQDERQADQLGLKYASLAGFDPSGLMHALTVIQKYSWMESNRIPPYLRTHPTGPERISNLESMLPNFPPHPSPEAIQLRRQYPIFRTIVRAKSINPQEAEQLFSKDLDEGRDVALAHLGLGIVYKEKSEYAEAVKHLKSALNGMASCTAIWMELAESYQLTGQDSQAIELFRKVLGENPNNHKAMLLLAESYENLGRYGEAITLLKRLSLSDAADPKVYYHLGMAYGRLNKLAIAHYYFGLYFKKRGSLEKARFHFLEARRLAKGNVSLSQKIRTASKGIL